MGSLGGKPQKSESYNKAYGFGTYNFGPTVGWGNAATSQIGDILGLSNPGYWVDRSNDGVSGNSSGKADPQWIGGPGGTAGGGYSPGSGAGGSGNSLGALGNYFNSSGGQFLLNQGLDALTNKFSALGLTKSGAAMKGMEQFRQDLASTKLDNYLGHLNELSRLGLGAGGLITGAGQYSKGTGGTQGAAPLIGAGLSAIASLSDRRCKVKIERVGDWDDRGDGLGKYRFAYKWEPNEILEGVMADEVEQLRPAAFIPNFKGEFAGVNYALLGAA